MYNVYQARKRQNLPFLPVILEWTPIIIFSVSCVAWLGSPHTTLLEENHLVLFCLTLSFVFGRMTTKIILAHLTKQPFPYWTTLLIPLASGALLVNILPMMGMYVVLSINYILHTDIGRALDLRYQPVWSSGTSVATSCWRSWSTFGGQFLSSIQYADIWAFNVSG